MVDEVRADTADLRRFVEAGAGYLFGLQTILDTVAARRSVVASALGHRVEVDPTAAFQELIAEAATNNRFVETIADALARHDADARVATAPAGAVDRALADAGLALTGRDLPLADDRQLANRVDGGPVGDEALELLGRWLHDNDLPHVGFDAFEAMALTGAAPGPGTRADLPPEVRAAARYLYRHPQLYLAVARMCGPRQQLGIPGLSVDDLATTLRVNRGLRVLSDRRTFGLVDADGDGHVTWGEVTSANGLSPADLQRLQGLADLGRDPLRALAQGNVPIIALAALAEERGVGGSPGLTGTFDDGLSYDDVVGATVNLHAFADDPAGAYRFVTQLPTSFDDLSGRTSGFDTRLVDDDALRATAGAALAGAPGLVGQTLVVAHLPESPGGVRNLLITTYYAELARRLNERLNGHLDDPLDPTLVGHSGAVWPVMAPFASNGVRPVITGDLTVLGGLVGPSQGDRQAAADGNQYIFGTIGPTTAAFLDAFPAGRPITTDLIKGFFGETTDPATDRSQIFRRGQADLRDGFVYFAAALAETDPTRRQELVFTANLLLATYEQGGAQNWIERLTDLDLDDDGWRASLQAGSWLIGGDEVFATGQIRFPLGIPTGRPDDDAETLRVALDVPRRPGVNNRLIGTPLVDFDPTAPEAQLVAFPGFTVGLDGAPGDVVTEQLGGWDDPPPGSGMAPLPTSVVDWAAEGQHNILVAGGTVVGERAGSGDGTDLAGTGALRWSDWEDRQWYIANLFHQFHTDPALFRNLLDYGPGRVDLHGDEALAAFVPPVVLATLGGGGP